MWLTRWDCNEAPPTISFNFAKDVCIAGVGQCLSFWWHLAGKLFYRREHLEL